jgi:[acyl-carrier-protein] S-malonyltransferase
MTAEAHRLAQQAAGRGRHAMGIVVGLSRAQVARLLEPLGPASVCLASSNSPTSHVLSGSRQAVAEVLQQAEDLQALKALQMDVDVPFHHRAVLAPATAQFRQFLRGLSWSAAACPVVSSIDQTLLRDPADLLELTAQNLSTPICWQRVVEVMAAQGVELVWESGPGVSLTQNARFIEGAPRHFNIRHAARRLGR